VLNEVWRLHSRLFVVEKGEVSPYQKSNTCIFLSALCALSLLLETSVIGEHLTKEFLKELSSSCRRRWLWLCRCETQKEALSAFKETSIFLFSTHASNFKFVNSFAARDFSYRNKTWRHRYEALVFSTKISKVDVITVQKSYGYITCHGYCG
jgi:hypothetical protein